MHKYKSNIQTPCDKYRHNLSFFRDFRKKTKIQPFQQDFAVFTCIYLSRFIELILNLSFISFN